jgi:hypothetical protein
MLGDDELKYFSGAMAATSPGAGSARAGTAVGPVAAGIVIVDGKHAWIASYSIRQAVLVACKRAGGHQRTALDSSM